MAEQARVSIRNIRRDANKQIEQAQKNKSITEDDRDEGKKEMDELTKSNIDKIDKTLHESGRGRKYYLCTDCHFTS